MKSIKGAMPINMPSTTFLSDTCKLHVYFKDGAEHVKQVQLMEIDGAIICPICESERRTKELEMELYDLHRDKLENPNRFIFLKDSLVSDGTILNARFNTYKAEIEEEKENFILVKKSLHDFMDGKKFNLWLQGNPGAGKSHLAYSFAHEANKQGNYKVLFVDMSELMKSIRETFRNNKFDDSEQAIVRRLCEADLLVLDDVGAEVGSVDTNNTASDFVNRVIFAIFNGRQGKCTICTTNLSGAQIKAIYDTKTFSRMFTNYRCIVFTQAKDRRFVELPF